MPYDATVFKVMIASPGDVSVEKNITREVIHEWNAINSDTRKIVLLPVSWDTHSTPEMGDRPQALINKQVLKDCDLLVGVFWTRIGTPTGESPSGTVEEITEHIKAGKPAMIYFSAAPVVPDSIDASQYAELNKFKNKCKSDGLCETYSDVNDFRSKFSRQLQTVLNKHTYFTVISQTPSEMEIKESAVPKIPPLSQEAQILLKEASQDPNGNIIQLEFIGGFQIQTNNKTFGNDEGPRDEAVWKGALRELERFGLIMDRGYKREVFEITREGYQVAEIISPMV